MRTNSSCSFQWFWVVITAVVLEGPSFVNGFSSTTGRPRIRGESSYPTFAVTKPAVARTDSSTWRDTNNYYNRERSTIIRQSSWRIPTVPRPSSSSTRLYASTNIIRRPLFTQVISDVDDTLKSSGGVNVAGVNLGGIDVQYNRGSIYPGVAEFMLQISIGVDCDNTNNKNNALQPAKVAILTARAEEFKIALELKETNPISIAFRAAATKIGISGWGIGPVLYGSVAEWIVQDRKGLRKFTNFERLLQQDPTGIIFQYVYVGDTGELDQEAGETMLREYPEVVKAVFLHVVSNSMNQQQQQQGQQEQPGYGGDNVVIVPPPKLINGRPIVFFRTYVGAAVAAVQLGLMSLDGLEMVVDAACEQLSSVPKSSSKWIDLNRDLDQADNLLLM